MMIRSKFVKNAEAISGAILLSINSGCLAEVSLEENLFPLESSGSAVCDAAIKDYNDGIQADRSIMLLKCSFGISSNLTKPSSSLNIGQIKTWSGPNQSCQYDFIPRNKSENPTEYYYRAIFGYQEFRYKILGENSQTEVDLDCINRVFPELDSLDSLFSSRLNDPIFRYMRGMRLLSSGCSSAVTIQRDLNAAGRARVPNDYRNREIYIKRDQTSIVPEALYVSALVSIACFGDLDAYYGLIGESISGGYSFARFVEIIGA